jgi:hypothetical protein
MLLDHFGLLEHAPMKPTPEALYLQIGQLVASIPDFANAAGITHEMNQWLARATVLVEQTGDISDYAGLKVISDNLAGGRRAENAQRTSSIVLRALARAEMAAPASMQGTFLPVGNSYEAFVAIGRVLGRATSEALIVDPFGDHKLLEHALQAPESISLKLLVRNSARNASLRPAAERWIEQFGAGRPIEVRALPIDELHDRFIFIDGKEAWSIGQSFNAIATRSPTSIDRSPPETEAIKLEAFGLLWEKAALQVKSPQGVVPSGL